MANETADRVSALIAECARVERESESVYLSLGRLFPQLSSEMQRSTAIAERSLKGFGAILSGSSSGSGTEARQAGESSIRAMKSFVKDSATFFRAMHERDRGFLARIVESIERLGSLDAIIFRVRSDSEEMEIVSLNAMTVALKSGAEGKAFSVITDELKRLSGRTIALTETVTKLGRSQLDFFSRLRSSLSELDRFQEGFFASLEQSLAAGFAEVEGEAVEAGRFFGALLAEARGVKAPVLRVMQEVQLQDIVRQSLQHVGISLEEARVAAETAGGEPAFVATVAELSEGLIDDVVGKLAASAASFESDMDAVRAIVGGCERGRAEYLAKQGSRCADLDLDAYGAGSTRYLGYKRDIVAMAKRMAEQVHGLDESFKALAKLLSRFQTIVVASRIEVAKTRALSGVANTVAEMMTLTERIEGDVGEAMGTTKEFIQLASAAIGDYSSESGGEDERLVAALRGVEEDIRGLDSSRASVCGAIDAFSPYTQEFVALIDAARGDLGDLRALCERLKGVRSLLGDLKAGIRADMPADAPPLEQGRLKRMVERFTIFTHKKAAGAIGSFQVEEGAEAGVVTLF